MLSVINRNSSKSKLVIPFVKWVGGKRQLISEIIKELPKDFKKLNYCEPFVGGGALFFYFQPKKAIINDANADLINAYCVIKDQVETLIESLKNHKNEAEYFYKLRVQDRDRLFVNLSAVEKASRFIYLNKTCYNGLYRVNNAGEFNSPFGKYPNPNIVNEPVLRAISKYLNSSSVTISSVDYEASLESIDKHSFVYFDPPYHPLSSSSSFTGYVAGGWDEMEQTRLRNFCNQLTARGVRFLLSNSSCDFIHDLYQGYRITRVNASRAINSVGSKRGDVEEVLIKNYE